MFKRVIGVAVVSAVVGVGLSTVTQSSVSPARYAPVSAVCTVNCLQVKPVGVTKFNQLSKSIDIQPALGRNVLQQTDSPQKELNE